MSNNYYKKLKKGFCLSEVKEGQTWWCFSIKITPAGSLQSIYRLREVEVTTDKGTGDLRFTGIGNDNFSRTVWECLSDVDFYAAKTKEEILITWNAVIDTGIITLQEKVNNTIRRLESYKK